MSRTRNLIFSTDTSSDGAGLVMIRISSTSRQPQRDAWTIESLINEHSISLGYSLDTSSFELYTSALNSYITFCNMHNLLGVDLGLGRRENTRNQVNIKVPS